MKNTTFLNLKTKDATSPISNILLIGIMYLLFFTQVYSYMGSPYVPQFKGSFVYEQLAVSDKSTMILSVTAIFFVLFLFLNTRFFASGSYLLIGFILTCGVCVWTVLAAMDIGFGMLLYTSAPPWVFLTALMFCVGMNKNLFRLFLKHAKILGILSAVMCAITTISFFMSHSGNVLADCSNLRYYIQGFWLLCICSFFEEKSNKLFVYGSIVFFAISSFAFSSRSWLIQSVIWLVAYAYFSQKQKSLSKFVKTVIVAIFFVGIAYFLVDRYFPDLLEVLVEKDSPIDTRVHQYIDLFAQTDLWDYIIGNGYSFTYISSIQGGEYGYIDNAYLLVLVRYGLLIGLTYPLMFLIPIIKSKFSKHTIPLIMWLMALGGLSIFCGIIIDLKCMALPVVAGRCMYLVSKDKINQKETADDE